MKFMLTNGVLCCTLSAYNGFMKFVLFVTAAEHQKINL